VPSHEWGKESDMDLRLDQPHSARMYDYLLGGKDNYEADRAAAGEMIAVNPSVPPTVLSCVKLYARRWFACRFVNSKT